jgi:ElaB/YqjD/DUF883 family membrane-anchored ribosome-binding protein
MGERDDSLRTIADARTRLSALADELGRRAQPERVKAQAREMMTEQAEHLKERARDVTRHKVDEMKQHAKEAAMRKGMEWKHEVTETPRGMSWLGALIGAGIGSQLAKRYFLSREDRLEWRGDWRGREDRYRASDYERWGPHRGERRYDYEPGYPGPYSGRQGDVSWSQGEAGATWRGGEEEQGPGMRERAGEAVQSAKGRAGEAVQSAKERMGEAAQSASGVVQSAKDRAGDAVQSAKERVGEAMGTARERASEWRERIPSSDEMRYQARHWYWRAADEQPVALALGAIAVGALVASLLPVSSRERRMLEPARRKAEETVSQVGDRLEEKLGTSTSQQQERGGQEEASSAQLRSPRTDVPGENWGGQDVPGRAWNDRREVHSPDMSAATKGSSTPQTAEPLVRKPEDRRQPAAYEAAQTQTPGVTPSSGPQATGAAQPLGPLPTLDELSKKMH